MTKEYRYRLQKGSKKFICPKCNKKSFVRYIDTQTGNYLPEQYGRCDRESKCSYHLNPYLDGYTKTIFEQQQKVIGVTKVTIQKQNIFNSPTAPVFFDNDTFNKTLHPERYNTNRFLQNLITNVPYPFNKTDIEAVAKKYCLGTIIKGNMAGAITFPFIDINGNVLAIQVKQFDKNNHTTATNKLDKVLLSGLKAENKTAPGWLTKYIEYGDRDGYFNCLFGSHLLNLYPNNPVALVEAPKSAIYGWLYFNKHAIAKNWVWLAVYNKSSFSFDKLKVLKGRDIFVFPDLSSNGQTFNEWQTKAKEYESRLPGTRFIFSDLLEQLAPERDKSEGNDLADYLIKQDWRLFRKRNIQEQPPQPEPEKVTKVTKVTPQQNIIFSHAEPLPKVKVFKTERIERFKKEQPQNWNNYISNIETYFSNIEIPTTPIKLNKWSIITNCALFIESHLATVKANNGKHTYLPYLNRLHELKKVIESGLM